MDDRLFLKEQKIYVSNLPWMIDIEFRVFTILSIQRLVTIPGLRQQMKKNITQQTANGKTQQ